MYTKAQYADAIIIQYSNPNFILITHLIMLKAVLAWVGCKWIIEEKKTISIFFYERSMNVKIRKIVSDQIKKIPGSD